MSGDLLLTMAIGVGLVVSLLMSEVFGLAAGGVVVPGYLALSLHRPLSIAVTLLVALLSFLVVRGLSAYLIVYGRRRTSLMILVGYFFGVVAEFVIRPQLGVWLGAEAGIGLPGVSRDFQVVGFVIPGLIAIWLDRQGIVQTLAVMFTAAAMVRLVLLGVTGEPIGVQ